MSDLTASIPRACIKPQISDEEACYNTILCLSRGLAAHFDVYVSPALAAETMSRNLVSSLELKKAFEPVSVEPQAPFRLNNFICRVDPALQPGEFRFKLSRPVEAENG